MMNLSARILLKKEQSFLLMACLDGHKEIDSLQANAIWTLVDLPEGQKAIGSKWVFAVKRKKTGQVERLKFRLVAKGCAQRYGVNFTETFSLMSRYSSNKRVIALAVENVFFMHQMDVSSAYLIYMVLFTCVDQKDLSMSNIRIEC
ncbi:uncharacterized mitochondrial protein AtMg00820-like [Drosophila santomea]|uniref:uncharacterized mitochondrial protein AtMg00820-like n=1 Tax=Drosophila santomea TaxID=129105 RepID=UPI001CCCAD79|nr:uncharacterized mitochondrial protein AtMg00820-like [Drosophila santomea]XP_043862598.1 uncharacterized mitochondrial protein AtMg00820-like [Drosophila santomea]